jgi:hypothetical protein
MKNDTLSTIGLLILSVVVVVVVGMCIYISILFILFLVDVKFAATHLQNIGVGIALWTILMV